MPELIATLWTLILQDTSDNDCKYEFKVAAFTRDHAILQAGVYMAELGMNTMPMIVKAVENTGEGVKMPRTYCTMGHQQGEHDASCMPPAEPDNPELRLLYAIFGLCPLCDETANHEHTDSEYTSRGMVPWHE